MFCFFCCLMLFPVLGFTQDKRSVYTLEQAISEALANNWALMAREEKIDQAIQVKKQARAEFLPKLSTTYGYTRLSEVTTLNLPLPGISDITVSSEDNYQWKGTITQPLFTGFALISSYELAKARLRRAMGEY